MCVCVRVCVRVPRCFRASLIMSFNQSSFNVALQSINLECPAVALRTVQNLFNALPSLQPHVQRPGNQS